MRGKAKVVGTYQYLGHSLCMNDGGYGTEERERKGAVYSVACHVIAYSN